MTLFLIRHGETDWNLQGRRQGHIDIPLNAEGQRQIRRCGEALSSLQINEIITSPLSRANESAQILASCLHIDPAQNHLLSPLAFDLFPADARSFLRQHHIIKK